MRVLGSSVLAFEAIVVLLATALAASDTGVNATTAWLVGLGLIVLLAVAAGSVTRPWGVALGWVLQAAVVATALVVGWTMLVVGGVFALLWFVAVRNGRRIDAQRAAEASGSE